MCPMTPRRGSLPFHPSLVSNSFHGFYGDLVRTLQKDRKDKKTKKDRMVKKKEGEGRKEEEV